MILENYFTDPGVYLTAPVAGYFQYPMGPMLAKKYADLPNGFLFKAVSRSTTMPESEVESVMRVNQRFWDFAWGTLQTISQYPDDPDLIALVLNYATYRQIFAEYAAGLGFWDVAIDSSKAVLEVNPGPLIQKLNSIYARQGNRYVMSDMIQRAQSILQHRIPQPPML